MCDKYFYTGRPLSIPMSRKSTCRGAAVLFLYCWIFRLQSIQILCNLYHPKVQHNYCLSQPGMELFDLHVLLSCQYQYTTITSLSSPFSGSSVVSSKQAGSNYLKWWCLNMGGILELAWLHIRLQNPSRFLHLFHKTVTVDHCLGEQFPSTWCESMHDSAYTTNVNELGVEPQYINHINMHFYSS